MELNLMVSQFHQNHQSSVKNTDHINLVRKHIDKIDPNN